MLVCRPCIDSEQLAIDLQRNKFARLYEANQFLIIRLVAVPWMATTARRPLTKPLADLIERRMAEHLKQPCGMGLSKAFEQSSVTGSERALDNAGISVRDQLAHA